MLHAVRVIGRSGLLAAGVLAAAPGPAQEAICAGADLGTYAAVAARDDHCRAAGIGPGSGGHAGFQDLLAREGPGCLAAFEAAYAQAQAAVPGLDCARERERLRMLARTVR
jgi:hypothetical protein